jgi:hypothetical protein
MLYIPCPTKEVARGEPLTIHKRRHRRKRAVQRATAIRLGSGHESGHPDKGLRTMSGLHPALVNPRFREGVSCRLWEGWDGWEGRSKISL